MKTVYLHIGIGKTGTSSIQHYFVRNKEALCNNYIFLPNTGMDINGAHHSIANYRLHEVDENTRKLYTDLVREISSSGMDRIFISSEQFSFLRSDLIRSVKEYFSEFCVKVLFYVRSQAELIESTYLEMQKWDKAQRPKFYEDSNGDIGTFFRLTKDAFNFQLRISPWVKHFGEENMIVRLYDRRAIGDDVCVDVLSLLNVAHIYKPGGYEKNISLLPEFSELVHILDKVNIGKLTRQAIINELIRLSKGFKRVSTKSIMDDDLKEEIRAYYLESNIEFSRRFFDDRTSAILCKLKGG